VENQNLFYVVDVMLPDEALYPSDSPQAAQYQRLGGLIGGQSILGTNSCDGISHAVKDETKYLKRI
jgi:hypothetical protein